MSTDTLELKVGRVYEGKRSAMVGFCPSLRNDRMIKWMRPDGQQLQYDSPSVKIGSRLPTVSAAEFRKWAKRDVTNEMPEGEWRQQ